MCIEGPGEFNVAKVNCCIQKITASEGAASAPCRLSSDLTAALGVCWDCASQKILDRAQEGQEIMTVAKLNSRIQSMTAPESAASGPGSPASQSTAVAGLIPSPALSVKVPLKIPTPPMTLELCQPP